MELSRTIGAKETINDIKIVYFDTIDSTHLYAIRSLEALRISEECVIVAKTQTNGIGRYGRPWISNEGNLFASIIRKAPLEDVGQLSLTTACAVREAISFYIGDSSYLKLHWPNDIHYKRLKICGILAARINKWLIISTGVNVNSAPDSIPATSVMDICGKRSSEHEGSLCSPSVMQKLSKKYTNSTINSCNVNAFGLLEHILKNIDKWFLLLHEDGFSYIRSYWLRNINDIKCNVVIKKGDRSINGILRDIDNFGRLVLETNGEILSISSGELFSNQKEITVHHE